MQFDHNAVITIQGGGVYGISLLGQLRGLNMAGIRPIAFAGTSIGAVIATLSWAGLTPEEIVERLAALAEQKTARDCTGLVDLFGPHAGSTAAHLSEFRGDYRRLIKILDLIHKRDNHANQPYDSDSGDQTPGPSNRLSTAEHLDSTRVKNTALGGAMSTAVGVVSTLGFLSRTAFFLLRYPRIAKFAFDTSQNRGSFTAARFEQSIDDWMRASRSLAGSALASKPSPLTFGDLQDHAAAAGIYFPPLFLTATNLTEGRLEIINSFQPEYRDVPVSRAVRASAGYPLILRPVELTVAGRPCLYLDGGIVSNRPAWLFGRDFRKMMHASPLYSDLAARPWINVALTLDPTQAGGSPPDPTDPASGNGTMTRFYPAFFRFLTGTARDELERQLVSLAPRSFLIRQPIKTFAPKEEEAWHIHKIDEARVGAMFFSAADGAAKQLATLSFEMPRDVDAQRIVALLARLAALFRIAIQLPGRATDGDVHVRINLFVPQKAELKIAYSWNMQGAPDADASFDFQCGHVGRCYSRRRPVVGDVGMVLRKVLYWDSRDRPRPMSEELQNVMKFYGTDPEHFLPTSQVTPLPTWIACVPIFDPHETHQVRAPGGVVADNSPDSLGIVGPQNGESTRRDRFYAEVEPRLDGAVLGVLELDAALDYNSLGLSPDIPTQVDTDQRVGIVLALLQDSALDLGSILGSSFGRVRT